MAIAETVNLVRLPLGERPLYSTPYPGGIAVAHRTTVGDATGGIITWSMLSDGGFLFRLEGIQLVVGTSTVDVTHLITSHQWAEAKSGQGTSSWNLNWGMGFYLAATGFQVISLTGGNQTGGGQPPLEQIRRLPMGRLDAVSAQQVMLLSIEGNIDTMTYEMSAWCTYWPKTALYRPGFLESFYESPVVPPITREG